MKSRLLLLIGIITALATTAEAQTVYVAGKQDKAIKVWKNGVLLHTLTDGVEYTMAEDIFVDGDDVYVAGAEYNANRKYVAKIWKNGSEAFTFGSGEYESNAVGVHVSAGNVYTAGTEYTKTGSIARIWKNNEVLYELATNDNNPVLTAMYVDGNDIYVCGTSEETPFSRRKATVWKNGSKLFMFGPSVSSGTTWSNAYDIAVSDGRVYVSGYDTNITVAVVYCYSGSSSDGVICRYAATQRVNPSAYAYTLDVVGRDVYTIVTSGTRIVYKNSSELYSLNPAYAYDISVKDNNVYMTGMESDIGKVWKNGEELYTLDGGTSGIALFVVPSTTGIRTPAEESLSISFSPVTGSVTVSGLQGHEILTFYAINGQMLLSHQATGRTESVAVGHLPAGMYLVRVDTKVLKWVKR